MSSLLSGLDFYRPYRNRKIHQGLDGVLDSVVGRYYRRSSRIEVFAVLADQVLEQDGNLLHLTRLELSEKIAAVSVEFIRSSPPSDERLVYALALLARMSEQVVGLYPRKNQLMAIIALQKDCVIEMDTGEGKTLVVGLAGILFGWRRKPCHLLTVNDYLAERDCDFIKPLAEVCGLSCAFVVASQSPQERQGAYRSDLLYTSGHELLADYLKDQIALKAYKSHAHWTIQKCVADTASDLITRGIHSVIIDEVDSVLIDQAVSPLLISAPGNDESLAAAILLARQLCSDFSEGLHYRLQQEYRSVDFSVLGDERVAELASRLPAMWRRVSRAKELFATAIAAAEFYHAGRDYIVEDDKVVIVDESTGRKMPERSWSQGLHQAIEAKEDVEITPPNYTLERMSFQNFFRLFARVGGVSGTIREAAAELWHIYRLPTLHIPRHTPCLRQGEPMQLFACQADKWDYLLGLAREKHKQEQPLLIGTRNVRDSVALAESFDRQQLPYQLLNANQALDEAEIISRAGELGSITIATNMAGRGTDIKLETGATERGGLHVVVTELHRSARVDRQLIGRGARSGDEGSYQVLISLEDELLVNYLPKRLLGLLSRWCRNGGRGLIYPAIQLLCKLSQSRSESQARSQRQQVLQQDLELKSSLSFSRG